MAYGATTKAARAAARTAALAAAEELAARTRANMADLAAFFSARERAEAVDGWLAEKVSALQQQAAARREEQRLAYGRALAAMAARGESVRDIAGMAGLEVKVVRELIRVARQAIPAPIAGAAQSPSAISDVWGDTPVVAAPDSGSGSDGQL